MDARLLTMINESKNVVFFGGAGVSTESGIPDFRSENGVYKAREGYGYDPERIVSHSFYVSHNELFYKFYKENLVYEEVEPNEAHYALAKLEELGKLSAVVTQNIDSLHEKAGSKNVFHLHGTVERNFCEKCGQLHSLEYIMDLDNCKDLVPRCSKCGGRVKPDVVLFEEGLDEAIITGAIEAISKADMLIIGGTSLAVYPAAGLINYFRGDKLVLINKTETPYDRRATLAIYDNIGKVMELDEHTCIK